MFAFSHKKSTMGRPAVQAANPMDLQLFTRSGESSPRKIHSPPPLRTPTAVMLFAAAKRVVFMGGTICVLWSAFMRTEGFTKSVTERRNNPDYQKLLRLINLHTLK